MSRRASKDNPTRPNTTPQALTTARAMFPIARAETQPVPRPEEWLHHFNLTRYGSTATPGSWHVGSRRRGNSSPREAGHSVGGGQYRPRVFPLSRPRVFPLVVPGHEILTESMRVQAENPSAESPFVGCGDAATRGRPRHSDDAQRPSAHSSRLVQARQMHRPTHADAPEVSFCRGGWWQEPHFGAAFRSQHPGRRPAGLRAS